jgi:UDP-glucose 4-epimerase
MVIHRKVKQKHPEITSAFRLFGAIDCAAIRHSPFPEIRFFPLTPRRSRHIISVPIFRRIAGIRRGSPALCTRLFTLGRINDLSGSLKSVHPLGNISKTMSDLTNTFNKRKVIITGGLGFIGSALARRLVDLGAEVLLVDSLIPEYGGHPFNISGLENRVRVNISDARDDHSMRYLVQDQDYLFNLAGQTSHLDSMQDPYTDLEINTRAQLSILETCRKYNPDIQIVFASTRQIYGKPEYLPVDENHLLRPVDVNGINKMAGEWYHILYNNVYGIRACALRLTNTIGPRMRIKDARQTFLGIWIRLLLEGRPFEVWNGNQLRDFTYVDDVVEAFLLAAASQNVNGEVFNLGGDRAIKLSELADLLIEINGGGDYQIREFPSDRKSIDIGDYYANYDRIRTQLGWEPKVTLKEGLARTLTFCRENLGQYI